MDYKSIIHEACAGNDRLEELLTTHSRAVADLALEIADRMQLPIDRNFLEEAAMLHDIGVVRCDAKRIHCTGELPYICHGVAGREMLDDMGLPLHALICERHTGSGLTVDDIIKEKLPLPHRDMTPRSICEKLICYADTFYSKDPSRLTHRKSMEEVVKSLKRYGKHTVARFIQLHEIFREAQVV